MKSANSMQNYLNSGFIYLFNYPRGLCLHNLQPLLCAPKRSRNQRKQKLLVPLKHLTNTRHLINSKVFC